MEKQKKKQNGITLIALVISIIVMLILAGVSLNMTIGENGIVTKAQEAAEISKKTSIIEEIQNHLMRYNIDLLSGDKKTAAKTAIDNLIRDKIIDNCMAGDGSFTTDTTKLTAIPLTLDDGSWTGEFEYVVGKDNYNFNIYQDKEGIFKAEISDIIAGVGAAGGEVTGGKTLVTNETFTSGDSDTTDANEKGKYTIVGNASVIFADELSGEYSIYVKSGANATVSIFYDMTLSNSNLQRSAIDIEPGGTLNLWIAEGAHVTVNSGYGGVSTPAIAWNFKSSEGVIGGNGAFAGIHVPHYDTETTRRFVQVNSDKESSDYGQVIRDSDGNAVYRSMTYPAGDAILNLLGKGTITCFGGDAGDGGDGGRNNLDWAAGAGGGAGAGIGGNGGNGANGTNSPTAGEKGEDCGVINISNSLTVNAYGGTGGSGGGLTINVNKDTGKVDVQSGGGGGGFPGAGIGGGGAGGGTGSTNYSGGGFSNGAGEYTYASIGGVDGKSFTIQQTGSTTIGGSYYESYAFTPAASDNILSISNRLPENYAETTTTNEKYQYLMGESPTSGLSAGIGGCLTGAYGTYPGAEISGQGGKGGTITVSSKAIVNAYNGSYITTKDGSAMAETEKQNTQALIYAQAGYDIKSITLLHIVKGVNARTIPALVTEWSRTGSNYSAYRTILSPYDSSCGTTLSGAYVLGIGSGAGGQQVTTGNGTYSIDESLN